VYFHPEDREGQRRDRGKRREGQRGTEGRWQEGTEEGEVLC
jgi:hypothetical protein